MSISSIDRTAWIEEWLRVHPEAIYEDAVFEFEDFIVDCYNREKAGVL